MKDGGRFFMAIALLLIFFGPSNCGGSRDAMDSIAVAIVKHLEK